MQVLELFELILIYYCIHILYRTKFYVLVCKRKYSLGTVNKLQDNCRFRHYISCTTLHRHIHHHHSNTPSSSPPHIPQPIF